MSFFIRLFFGAAVLGSSAALASPASEEWSVVETKSPIDDSPGLFAALASTAERSELSLRCKEGEVDVFVRLLGLYTSFNSSGVNVIYRIGDNKAVRTKWIASTDNRAVFVSNASTFLASLPDEGRLVVRIEDFRGSQTDHIFQLRDVSNIRTRLTSLCPPKRKPKSSH